MYVLCIHMWVSLSICTCTRTCTEYVACCLLRVGSDWIKADDWMLVLRKRIKRVHLLETLNIHTYDIIYKGSI